MPLGAYRLNSLGRYLIPAAGRTAITVTANGDAKISTAQNKFGGASALIVSTDGSYLSMASNTFTFPQNQNFTIEFWWYAISYPTSNKRWFDFRVNNLNQGALFSGNSNLTQLQWRYNTALVCQTSNGIISTSVWHHIAVVRNSNTSKIYVDGVERASGTDNNNYQISDGFRIGASFNNDAQGMNGYYDEFRISNTARYTSNNFTVPTAAFVNDADTLLLLHMDGANNSTTFTDDNS
jgi:hypothetical protein